MRAARATGALVLALLCVFATQVQAAGGGDVRYSGKSGQGKKVVLITDRQGEIKRFVIHHDAVCGRGHIEDAIQRFIRPFRRADENGFYDRGIQRFTYGPGYKGRTQAVLTGKRTSIGSFKGEFSFKGRYFTKTGETITTCRAPSIHWDVSLPGRP